MGTNTYVYRFVMASLSLLDCFLIHSHLAVYILITLVPCFPPAYRLHTLYFECACVLHFFARFFTFLANNFVRFFVSFDIVCFFFACLWTGFHFDFTSIRGYSFVRFIFSSRFALRPLANFAHFAKFVSLPTPERRLKPYASEIAYCFIQCVIIFSI